MNNTKYVNAALKILRYWAKNEKNAARRSAFIQAHNLLVYAIRGDEEKMQKYLEEIS